MSMSEGEEEKGVHKEGKIMVKLFADIKRVSSKQGRSFKESRHERKKVDGTETN
jgi:hypothetical protein